MIVNAFTQSMKIKRTYEGCSMKTYETKVPKAILIENYTSGILRCSKYSSLNSIHFAPWALLKRVIEAFLLHLDQYILCSTYDLLCARKMMTFKLLFHVGKNVKITWSHVGAVGQIRTSWIPFFIQVCGCTLPWWSTSFFAGYNFWSHFTTLYLGAQLFDEHKIYTTCLSQHTLSTDAVFGCNRHCHGWQK